MPGFSHVRFNPFDRERYTDAQALELQQLRAFYTTHLVPVFGAVLPDAFVLREENDHYYPRYTATTLTPPLLTPVPPSSTLFAQPLKPFAETLVCTLAIYETARAQRRFGGKGHPNDPTRLFGVFLRNLCQNWLSHAPSNATTLRQVTALRQYLETLARENVFTAEGQGHDSMTVLLRNLAAPLSQLEKRLKYEINLQSAREHFAELKEGVTHVLSEAAQFLFCALANKDRTKLPFSLVNMQARVVNKPLTQALQTREGLLLKQWMHSLGITRTLLPQIEAKKSKDVLAQEPVSLFGAETPTSLLDEKGSAHSAWLGFLQGNEALEAQLAPSVKQLPSGICPLLESKTLSADEEDSVLAQAIQLHGLLQSLATYQNYLHQCWELAGFGGDNCVYDQMSEAVFSILTELRAFSQVLASRVAHFQERLDLSYKEALDTTAHIGWRSNYRTAKASQEKLLGMLTGCETALTRVMVHTQDTVARAERRTLAAKAYQALKNAPRFLNQARQQVGLAPKTRYLGLEAPDSKASSTVSDPFAVPLASEEMSIDQILVVLLPQSSTSVVWLSRLCAQTPTTTPWSIFRGSYQRYAYLHNNTRLKKIGQDLTRLQLNAQTPMTPEKSAFIEQLRQQLEEERARINQLRQPLRRPFHNASIQFFATWQQAITQKLLYLVQVSTPAVASTVRPTSMQGINQVLQSALPRPEETKHLERKHTGGLASQPLSSETQKKVAHLHSRYSQLTLQHRSRFDTWQQSRFGGLLWNAHGILQWELTESDGTAILEEWERLAFQQADEMIAAYRMEEQRIQTQMHSKYPSINESL